MNFVPPQQPNESNNAMNSLQTTARMAQAYMSTRPQPTREPLDQALRVGVMLGMLVVLWGIATLLGMLIGGPGGTILGAAIGFPISFILAGWLSAITRVAAQWERVVVLRLGRFHSIKGPGLLFVFPVLDYARFVDTRLLTIGIPSQQVITRDNVPVGIDGVVFFQVRDVEKAVVTVQDYRSAMLQYAQASLRDVVGSMSLDELLSERDEIQAKIATAVESRSAAWGIHVDSIRLLDINMPEELKRMMSRQASADREKRATIIKAEGDKEAAKNLAEAALTMTASPGAMQLRTLQTLDGLGASASNTVVLAVPIEVIELAQRLANRPT